MRTAANYLLHLLLIISRRTNSGQGLNVTCYFFLLLLTSYLT